MEKLAGSCPDVYIGSLISLTSKGEIRYEGVLHTLDTEKLTLVLADVRSFGTEGRGTNILQISASSQVYEYIIFRDTDIKDLSVLSSLGTSDKPGNKISKENGYMQNVKNPAEMLKSDSLEIAMGWPVSPFSLCTQECANWWQWLCSPAASSNNGLPSSVPLAYVPKGAHIEISPPSSSSCVQGNYGTAVTNPLANLEQVPNIISANVCDSKNLKVLQHLPDQGATSGNRFISGHSIIQPRMWPQGENLQIKPLHVQPSLQQPLLPLPVSETEHQRLIKESLCSGNLEHLRRPRFGSRGKIKGASHRGGAPSRTQNEASSSKQQFLEDFDFEAMNEHFKKKELWHDLDLTERQTLNAQGDQNGASENVSNTYNDSRKFLFVDDFFDLISSKEGHCKEPRVQETKFLKQSEIDLETFGVSARPRRGRQNGARKGSVCRMKCASIDAESNT